jgi:hypothetical protein
MTRNEAEMLLNKINIALGGRIFSVDRDGNVSTGQLEFYMDNLFADMDYVAGERMVKRILAQYDAIPRGTNMLKFLKENAGRRSSDNEAFEIYGRIKDPKMQAERIIAYIGNQATLADAEIYQRTKQYSFKHKDAITNIIKGYDYDERVAALMELIEEYVSNTGKQWFEIRKMTSLTQMICDRIDQKRKAAQ